MCSKQDMTTKRIPAPRAMAGRPVGDASVDVVFWRASRLRDAGFAADLAEDLAHQPVDLHALLQLVDRGCPPALAARILAPDDTETGAR
ncbi:MAG: hypothetical protein ABI249_03335 [Ornithinibacter sp.]